MGFLIYIQVQFCTRTLQVNTRKYYPFSSSTFTQFEQNATRLSPSSHEYGVRQHVSMSSSAFSMLFLVADRICFTLSKADLTPTKYVDSHPFPKNERAV